MQAVSYEHVHKVLQNFFPHVGNFEALLRNTGSVVVGEVALEMVGEKITLHAWDSPLRLMVPRGSHVQVVEHLQLSNYRMVDSRDGKLRFAIPCGSCNRNSCGNSLQICITPVEDISDIRSKLYEEKISCYINYYDGRRLFSLFPQETQLKKVKKSSATSWSHVFDRMYGYRAEVENMSDEEFQYEKSLRAFQTVPISDHPLEKADTAAFDNMLDNLTTTMKGMSDLDGMVAMDDVVEGVSAINLQSTQMEM